MNETDKAALIEWLAEKGYSIQSISDGGPGMGPSLQIIDGQVVQTKVTSIVISKTQTYTAT